MGLFSSVVRFFTGGSGGSAGDKTLQCQQCRRPFQFEAGEQVFFREKGFTEPKRCPTCRKQKKSGRRFGRRR